MTSFVMEYIVTFPVAITFETYGVIYEVIFEVIYEVIIFKFRVSIERF